MSNLISYLLILVPGAVWGASFIVTRLALPHFDPFTIAFGRSTISAVFLTALLTLLGAKLHSDRREWISIFVLSICNITAFTLTAFSQQHISGGLTTILAATIPFFTVIVAHFFDNNKINFVSVIGIGMGLLGVVVLVGGGALLEVGSDVLPQLGVLAASCLYGISAVYARPVLARQPKATSAWIPRIRVLAMQFIMSALLMLPFAAIVDQPWTRSAPPEAYGYLLFLGVGVTSFATLIYYFLIQTHGTTLASMTMYIIPVSGVTLGILLLSEVVTWTMPVAAVLILGGVWVMNRPKTTPKPLGT